MILMPFILVDEFWAINVVQMLVVMTLIIYVLYYGLSLNFFGVALRIFCRMVMVVVVFGSVSIVIITLIAYPIHVLFIQYDPRDGDERLNLFQDLYTGVLTLFEFTFGAVIFVRNYPNQGNVESYLMTFIMVIFSFFGNIMLANFMIAFLTNQFEDITKKAKYYTQRMQFGLIKVFGKHQLDTIYSLPYIFTIIFVPVFFCARKPGPKRYKINQFVRKVIHIVNIFIPTMTLMFLFLMFMLFKRYWEFLILSLLDVPLKPLKCLMHSIVWLFCGPILLTKLFVLDLITCGSILLNFRSDEHMDILELGLSAEEKTRLIDIFSNIETVARHLLYDKKIKKLTVKSFLFEVSVFYAKDLLISKNKDNTSIDEDDKEEHTKSNPTQRF